MKRQATAPVYKKPMLARSTASLTNPPQRKVYAEKKNIDTIAVSATLPIDQDFSNLLGLNGVGEGPGPEGRIGRKILMKSFFMRYRYEPADGETGQVRIMVVYDKQCNGTVPSNTAVITTNADILAFQNLDNSERFVIIADVLSEQGSSSGSPVVGDFYRKLNLDAIYGDGSSPGDMSEVKTGAIWLMAASGASGTAANFKFSTRIRFVDQ